VTGAQPSGDLRSRWPALRWPALRWPALRFCPGGATRPPALRRLPP